MKLFKIEAPTPGRILNIGNKSYTFNSEAICLIPEEDIISLPFIYKNLGFEKEILEEGIIIEDNENMETFQKIIEEPKDIKKVMKEDIIDIKK